MKSVVWAILCILVSDLVVHRNPGLFIRNFLTALDQSVRNIVSVATACACSGLIVGVISLTGLGLKFSSLIFSMSANSIWLALIMTMLASLILGCGLPTTAAYIVLATLAVPALVKLNVPDLAAHLFVFYFGIISTITPPVALSAYAAGGLADANPNTVGWTAFKFGIVAFIIPYMWIFSPGLILAAPVIRIVQVLITSTVGVAALAVGIQRFGLVPCGRVEQLLAIASGLLLIDAKLLTDTMGAVCILLFLILHTVNRRRRSAAPRTISG